MKKRVQPGNIKKEIILKKPQLRVSVVNPFFILLLSLFSVLILHTLSSTSYASRIYFSKRGVVSAKGFVKGPQGNPIYAEFNSEGTVSKIIGEAVPGTRLGDSTVMAASIYNAYKTEYNDYKEANSTGEAQGSYLLTPAEYNSTIFTTPDGTVIKKAYLKIETNSVLVRPSQKLLTSATNPILFESLIDLKNASLLTSELQSVLVSNDGQIIHKSKNNIGFSVSFYEPKDFNPLDLGQAQMDGDRTYDHLAEDRGKVISPLVGNVVYVTNTYSSHSKTDEGGFFNLVYRVPGCPGFNYAVDINVIAELSYSKFNPKSPRPVGKYSAMIPHNDLCIGIG